MLPAKTAGLSKPAPGRYTQVVKAGKLLFIAGQTATNAEGKVVGSGMNEQMEQVFANLVTALKSQGADLSHVTKMTTFDQHPRIGPLWALSIEGRCLSGSHLLYLLEQHAGIKAKIEAPETWKDPVPDVPET